jgi:methionine-rich copper-binding protein CopC
LFRPRFVAITVAAAVLATAAIASPASAHAGLESANPSNNSLIYGLPKFITLKFNEDLVKDLKTANQIKVTNSKGLRVDSGTTEVSGSQAKTALKAGLTVGTYRITFRVLSEDGHPISDSYTFKFAKKSAVKK